MEIDFNKELLNRHPNDHKKTYPSFQKDKGYENELEKQRLKKWENIEEKPSENHTNRLKTAGNSANKYSTESHQQEQDSGYNDGAMSLKN